MVILIDSKYHIYRPWNVDPPFVQSKDVARYNTNNLLHILTVRKDVIICFILNIKSMIQASGYSFSASILIDRGGGGGYVESWVGCLTVCGSLLHTFCTSDGPTRLPLKVMLF